jgi:hypothetical protein
MKALLRQYFPVVYDTKVVATECSTPWKNDNTNLSNLFQKAVTENHALQNKIAVVAIGITIPAIRTKNTRLRTTPS